MTRDELIEKLQAIKDDGPEPEINHFNADELLLEYINDQEIEDLFNSIQKWYS
ncbi:hypothetical protein LCGC14_1162880 [marine sediment metagenome]|uniref:Uncharacterized protein n=1 Tax=marine sediment metagenome TaxID=412755 RepID=A0A0F9LX65_9ZZZZ